MPYLHLMRSKLKLRGHRLLSPITFVTARDIARYGEGSNIAQPV